MSNFVLSVMISVLSNIIVVVVLWFRRKRMKAPHWFIVALAISGLTRIQFPLCKKLIHLPSIMNHDLGFLLFLPGTPLSRTLEGIFEMTQHPSKGPLHRLLLCFQNGKDAKTQSVVGH